MSLSDEDDYNDWYTIQEFVPCFDMREPILIEPGHRESHRARILARFCLEWAGLGYLQRTTAGLIRGILFASDPNLLSMVYLAKVAFCEIHRVMFDSLTDDDREEDRWHNYAASFHRCADLYIQVISFPSRAVQLGDRRLYAVEMHIERRRYERRRSQRPNA